MKKFKTIIIVTIPLLILIFYFRDNIRDLINENSLFFAKSEKKVQFIPKGRILFKDEFNKNILNIPGVVFNNDRIAIPARDFIYGIKWNFEINRKFYLIENGHWESGEIIGLWKINGLGKKKSKLILSKYDRNDEIIWHSLDNSNDKQIVTKIWKTKRIDNVELFILPKEINSAGMFLQNDKLVGWTFESLLPYGVLWKGEEDIKSKKIISHSYLFDNYCINGKEYIFNKALSVNNSREKLKLLVKAVLLPFQFKSFNRNKNIDNSNLLNEIYKTSETLKKSGKWIDLQMYLNPQVVTACNSTKILNVAIAATSKTNNYYKTIEIIDQIITSEDSSEKIQEAAREKYIEFTIEEIKSLMKKDKNLEALTLFNKLNSKTNNNPEANLLGVKLLLWLNDLTGAKYLLNSINYPAKYNLTLNELWIELDKLKEKSEGVNNNEVKSIVHFPKGASSIDVQAVINDFTQQEFIIDTGASMTTLPQSTLVELGVHIMMDSPVHKVSTAGGIISAREVRIDSIGFNNSRVENMDVLALDLPGQPGKGLLGMNFLKHFHVEINHDKGILTLTPRDE